MNKDHIQIIGRHVQVTEAMKQHAMDKLSRIRTQDPVMDIHVVMDIEHLEHIVTILVKFDHFRVKAHGSSHDMYASIDQAVHRIESQLRRWKDKIQNHRNKKRSVVDMKVNVWKRTASEIDEYNEEIEAQNAKHKTLCIPTIKGRETVPLKELTAEEAVMKLDLSGDRFLVYRSEEDRKLKVMYRRNDGDYGIIQPE